MIANADAIKAAVKIESVIGHFIELKKEGPHFAGLCPFHKEKTPSLKVTPDKGIFKCFGCDATGNVFQFVQKLENLSFPAAVRKVAEIAGISVEESAAPVRSISAPVVKPVVPIPQQKPAAPEVAVKPKIVAVYPYVDANGTPLYEVVRFEPGSKGQKKDFRQRRQHPDGGWAWALAEGSYRRGAQGDWYATTEESEGNTRLPAAQRVLFRLPAILLSDEVWVVEGEKDVLTLESLGFVATTNSGGSKQAWLPEYSEALRGRRVIIVPDGDATGEAHGRKIQAALAGIASEVVFVPMPKGFKDVTEYIESGRSAEDLSAVVEFVEREAVEADRRYRGLLSPEEVIHRYDGGLNAFLDPSHRARGAQTAFTKLDEMTLGLHPGELFVLAARPAMGKTALALNIASNVARQRKKAVAIFSLEMSAESLLQRMTCAMASVDSLAFRSGHVQPSDRPKLQNAVYELSNIPLFIDDYTPLNIEEFRRKLALFTENNDLGLVIVDYLQLMDGSKRSRASGANRVAEVSEQSRSLKLMSREFKVPIMVLSQLSRACEIRPGDHRPQLSDLRDSGSIEQDADVVAFVYRKEIYEPHKPELRGKAELIIAKHRNGPTGTVRLDFKHEYTRFDNALTNVHDYEDAA